MNLLDSFPFPEELLGQEFKESPLLILPEMATNCFTICGHVASQKRNFYGDAKRASRFILRTVFL